MSGSSDVDKAATIQGDLFSAYSSVGRPALGMSLSYSGSMLNQGLPQYAQAAFGSQQAGMFGQLSRGLASGVGSGASALGRGSGAGFGALTSLASNAGSAYGMGRAQVGANRAMSELSQRNNLLSIMSGTGAAATGLAGGAGALSNYGFSLSQMPNPAIGLGFGALGSGLAIYGQQQSSLANNALVNAISGYGNPYEGAGPSPGMPTGGT